MGIVQFAEEKKLYKFYLLVVFITLVIPKAGDKVAGVPLTLASLMFALLLLWAVPVLVKRKIPMTDKGYLLYISLVLLPWLISGAGIGAFARIVLPLFVPLAIYYWINPITQNLITDGNKLYRLVKLVAAANIIIAFYGFIQLIFGHYQTIIPGITMSYTDAVTPEIFYLKSNQIGESYKVTSTYQNGNLFGTNLVMTTLPVLSALFCARAGKDKILFGISVILSFAIIPLTQSRAAMFGALTGAGIFFLLQKSKRIRLPVALAVLLVFAVILTSPSLKQRMIGNFFDPTLNGRFEVMQRFADKANLTPISGILGMWFNNRRPRLDNPAENIFNYSSENLYFTVAIWTGVIGLVLFIAVVVPLLIKMLKKIRATPPESFTLGLTAGVFAGLMGYLIQASIEGAFHLLPTGFVLWLLIGLGHVLTGKRLINE